MRFLTTLFDSSWRAIDCSALTMAPMPEVNYSPLMNGFAKQTVAFYAVVVFLISVVAGLVMKLRQSQLLRNMKLPPSPPAWPIVGHLHLLGKLPHQSLAKLALKYGEIYSLRLGSVPVIVVSTPEMAKIFLQSLDRIWASRSLQHLHAFYFSFNHTGIVFAQYTPMWRLLRKICMLELFTERRMEASQGLREEEMIYMSRSIFHDTQQVERTVELQLKLHVLTANITSRMVLNRRFASSSTLSSNTEEEDIETHAFKEIVEELFILQGAFVIGDYVSWLRPLDIQGIEKRMKVLGARLDKFCTKIIHDHEVKRPNGPIAEKDKDMIDLLLHEMNKQDGAETLNTDEKIDLNNIKSFIINMFAGGTDTSTLTIEWAMSELIKNPSIMEKMKAELDSVVGKQRMVKESDIVNLKYLQAVVKETFRLHPVVPILIPHLSMQDCQVSGYHIPAGTRLYVNAYAIARSLNVWDRALEFDPERFMQIGGQDVDVRGKDFRILPFGSGRRGCPAISMGIVVVQLALATLAQAFDWSLPSGEDPKELDMSEGQGLSTPRAKPLCLRAHPRLPTYLYTTCPQHETIEG